MPGFVPTAWDKSCTEIVAHDQAVRAAFVAWSVTPESERTTRKLFAELNDINESTLTRWVKQGWYAKALDEAYAKQELTPEKLQDVVDALYAKAKNGDPRAMDLYLKHHQRVNELGSTDEAVSELSDEDLADALALELAATRERLHVG